MLVSVPAIPIFDNEIPECPCSIAVAAHYCIASIPVKLEWHAWWAEKEYL